LIGIRYPSQTKWSPQGKYIAFAGHYGWSKGIWVFDTDTRQLFLVWGDVEVFDGGVDGHSMAIVVEGHPSIVILALDFLEYP